jgi:hypothetical protein
VSFQEPFPTLPPEREIAAANLSWRFVIAKDAESMIVRADMSALEFHEAAWEAREGRIPPPDPASLSDRALYVVMGFQERDLPSDSLHALEAECRRRALLPDAFDRSLGLGLIALVAISGFVIGWMLFAS